MTTKIDFINEAYSRGRISGLTSSPTPEEINVGLKRLENMAHRWSEKNICVGYNFEVNPDPNSPHNVPRKYWDAFESNLMMGLLSHFGKQATPELAGDARTAYSDMASSTATIPRTPYPSRQPIGSGNTRWNQWRQFYSVVEQAPTECATVKMAIGDIDNFYEDFTAYLDEGETIASYDTPIEADSGLTITNDAINGSRIDYTVEAVGSSSEDFKSVFKVKIVMTTDAGRVETRLRNFELTDIEID